MGMYDYIKCEVALPDLPQQIIDNWRNDVVFQTKDTPNQSMSLYRINEELKLQVEQCEYEMEDRGPAPDDAGVFEQLAYGMHSVCKRKWWEDTQFTGAINFYESYDGQDTDICGWVEYCATVNSGVVNSIMLVKSEPPRNRTQEENDNIARMKAKFKAQNNEKIKKKIALIKEAKKQIKKLSEVQEHTYNKLLAEINVKDTDTNIEGWIFDFVYNDSKYALATLKKDLNPW